jgi:L-malate glycosyltransferase
MHILIVPSALYIPSHRSLSGIFQYHQAMALLRQGHKVGVASFGFKTMRHWWRSAGYPDREQPADNFVIIRKFQRLFLPHRFITPSAIEPYYSRGYRDVITRYIDEQGLPDVIHAHDYVYAGIAASEIGELFGVPVVVTVHSSDLAQKSTPESLIRRASEVSANVGATISVSRALKSRLMGMGIKSSLNEVVPNVIDPQHADRDLSSVTVSEVCGSVGFEYINIATMDDNKNHELLVNAFRKVLTHQPLSRLTLVGTGSNKRRLKRLVRHCDIAHRVEFIDYLNRDALFERLSAARCFVLTSRFETFGVVLIEAASVGLPVIATRCGGPEDIVEENSGMLVDSDNADQLVMAMLRVQGEALKYDRAAIRNNVLRRFGEEAIVRRLEHIYIAVNRMRGRVSLAGGL